MVEKRVCLVSIKPTTTMNGFSSRTLFFPHTHRLHFSQTVVCATFWVCLGLAQLENSCFGQIASCKTAKVDALVKTLKYHK